MGRVVAAAVYSAGKKVCNISLEEGAAWAAKPGHFVWIEPPEGKDSERWPHGIGRLAHEAAWRLSQQALRDLREWLAAERMKPRQL